MTGHPKELLPFSCLKMPCLFSNFTLIWEKRGFRQWPFPSRFVAAVNPFLWLFWFSAIFREDLGPWHEVLQALVWL